MELGHSFPVTRISYLKRSIAKENRFPHSGAIYRTDIYNKVGGYNNVRYFQDRLLFWKMSDYGDLALLPLPLVKYRMLAGSVAHRIDSSPYKEIIWAYKDKIYNEKGANETDIKLYNTIYDLIEKNHNDAFLYKQDKLNKLYNVLRKLLGDVTAYQLIVSIKNVASFLF